MAAFTLLNFKTGGFPERFAPVMVTFVPGLPKKAENPKIVGSTTKLLLEKACPPGAVTLINPVVAVAGSGAVICVLESTVNEEITLLNFTAVAPRKFFPVIITFVPKRPLPGEKLVMLAAAKKLLLVVKVRLERVKAIGPVDTPAGAEILICVSLVS